MIYPTNLISSYELELNNSDLHKTWSVLRVIIGIDTNSLKQKLKFQVNDKYVTGSLEIANIVLMSSLSRLNLNLRVIF